MNNLHWEIITKSDILISETTGAFLEDTKNIKSFYFTDGEIYCGVKDNLHFFINHQEIDLKLNQKILKFFQYKEVAVGLTQDYEDIVYNIGIDTEDNKYTYKYTMQIDTETIYLLAQKFDEGNQIEQKRIQLL